MANHFANLGGQCLHIDKPRYKSWDVCNKRNFSQSLSDFSPKATKKTTDCLMLYSLLTDYSFVKIDCQKKFLYTTMCEKHSAANVTDAFQTNLGKNCQRYLVLKYGLCYQFIWMKHSDISKKKNMTAHHKTLLQEIRDFEFIFAAVAINNFPRIFHTRLAVYITFTRYENIYNYTSHSIQNTAITALKIQSQLPVDLKDGLNIFQCEKGPRILVLFLCDHITDCSSGKPTDEGNCTCGKNKSQRCKYVSNSGNSLSNICSPLFYQNHKKDCHMYVFEGEERNVSTSQVNSRYFKCQSGKKIEHILLNDLVYDCLGYEDEPLLLSVVQNNSFHTCHQEYQISCRTGHSRCFNISEICSYKLNQHNVLTPCRTGEHIQECKNIECNMKFKCPNFYCIPFAYVCDGKWDCPHGHDDSSIFLCQKHKLCTHFFKCRNSSVCIHPGDVCDNTCDCPQGDDELLCSLQERTCLSVCSCLTYAISCTNAASKQLLLSKLSLFEVIFLSFCDPINMTNDLNWKSLIIVELLRVKLSLPCQMLDSANSLILLGFRFNEIDDLSPDCFAKTKSLIKIQITNNLISKIEPNLFVNVSSLTFLNLSNNPIYVLDVSMLSELKKLRFLSILNLTDIQNSLDELHFLNLGYIEVSNYQLCCLSQDEVQCSATVPWYSSCSNLLGSLSSQVILWVVTVAVSVFNCIHLILQYRTYKLKIDKTFAYGSVVSAISLSDIQIIVPFLSILIANEYFKGQFVLFEEVWRSSPPCYITFGSFLIFNFFSPLLISFYSITRLLVVLFPMDTKCKDTAFVVKCVMLIFFVSCLISGGLLSAVIVVVYPAIPTSLCIPYVDPSDQVIPIKVHTWITVILQFVATVFILVVYIALLNNLKASQKRLQSAKSSKRSSNATLVIQIIIITCSNIICWIPSGVIYIITMFMERYPTSMIVWNLFAVTPVNSMINPVVLVAMAIRKLVSEK